MKVARGIILVEASPSVDDIMSSLYEMMSAAEADLATNPPRRKANGFCRTCGAELPKVSRPRGGRPAEYCAGQGCAPSRPKVSSRATASS